MFSGKKPKAAAKKPYCRYVPAPVGPEPICDPSLSTEANREIYLKWLDRKLNPPVLDKGPEVEVAVCSFDGEITTGEPPDGITLESLLDAKKMLDSCSGVRAHMAVSPTFLQKVDGKWMYRRTDAIISDGPPIIFDGELDEGDQSLE